MPRCKHISYNFIQDLLMKTIKSNNLSIYISQSHNLMKLIIHLHQHHRPDGATLLLLCKQISKNIYMTPISIYSHIVKYTCTNQLTCVCMCVRLDFFQSPHKCTLRSSAGENLGNPGFRRLNVQFQRWREDF